MSKTNCDTDYPPQIDSDIYFSRHYLSPERFVGFSEQVNAVVDSANDSDNGRAIETIAEIGKGSGVTAAILREFGFDLSTIDFDPAVKPDIVASILDLESEINRQFDAVLCFEVLEHIRFEDVPQALQNLKAITGKKLFISLPYAGVTFKWQMLMAKYRSISLTLSKRIPMFWARHRFNGEHYWEPGKRGFSLGKIEQLFRENFKIKKRWFHPDNEVHVFYCLEPIR
jgi:Methyltransferase domain